MLLEIKSIPSKIDMPLSITETIAKIHLLIAQYSLEKVVKIISFDYRIIKESYKQNREIEIGLILHRNLIPLDEIVKSLNLSLLIVEKNWITQEQIKEIKRDNIEIFTWTVNTQNEYDRLKQIGVNGIITDNPKYFCNLT